MINIIYAINKGPKHQFLIKKRESTGLKHLNDSKFFIETKKNTNEKRKTLIVFDNIIADMLSN